MRRFYAAMICNTSVPYCLAFLLMAALVAILVLWLQNRRLSIAIETITTRSQLEHIAQEQRYLVALRKEMQEVGTHIHEHLAGAIAVLHKQVELRLLVPEDSDQQQWLLGLLQSVKEVYDIARGESHELYYGQADRAEQVFTDKAVGMIYTLLPAPLYQLACTIDTAALKRLPADQRFNLLMVIREVLVNIGKHASATYVSILFYEDIEGLVLTIKDDGVGFDTRAPGKKGIGLQGLKRRVQEMNGKLEIRSGKGGTEVTAIFPV